MCLCFGYAAQNAGNLLILRLGMICTFITNHSLHTMPQEKQVVTIDPCLKQANEITLKACACVMQVGMLD